MQLTNGKACSLPSNRSDTLSLPSNFLQPGMVFKFTVTVTSAPSGNCKRKRKATERRVLVTQRDPLPEMKVKVCKDARCRKQINLLGGVATVNTNRQKPNLFVQLQVNSSQCPAAMEVGWSTSMDSVHIKTQGLLKTHALKHAGHEMLKIAFDYSVPIAAKYTFSITAKCSQDGSSSSSVSLDVVMNDGPSGGKMKVSQWLI